MLKDYENHTQPLPEKKKIAFSDGLDITVIILVVGLFVAIILAFLAEFMFDLKINWKEVGIDTGIVAACTVAIYYYVPLRSGGAEKQNDMEKRQSDYKT